MRKIIFHYHLFKNAGTSIDAAFKQEFAAADCVTAEFPQDARKNKESVENWILDNPQARYFSSHTAMLPVPKLDDISVSPVIFIRNPLDRILSAYAFEMKQGGGSFGAVLARNTDLAGYIETRLSLPSDRQCRNFQTHRFAQTFGKDKGEELIRAKLAVDSLPFVGVVENYASSLGELNQALLNVGFEDIELKPMKKNVSSEASRTLEEKLDGLKHSLGTKLFDKLCEANEDDIALYHYITSRTEKT